MTTVFWTLGNAFLTLLILLRVPRIKATSTNIDTNPKILNITIWIATIVYLISNSYLNIYN
jgi:hypothetical protein